MFDSFDLWALGQIRPRKHLQQKREGSILTYSTGPLKK